MQTCSLFTTNIDILTLASLELLGWLSARAIKQRGPNNTKSIGALHKLRLGSFVDAAPVHMQRAKGVSMDGLQGTACLGLTPGLTDGDHDLWDDASDALETGPAEVSDSSH